MAVPERRSYHSPTRAAQAGQTKARIGEAAAAEFAEHGWSGTTVAAIAARAGVTPQAVHLAVGGKAALLIRAVEVAVSGASDDLPLAQRPDFETVYASGIPANERIRAFAEACAAAYHRSARLFLVLQDAAQSDATVAELAGDGARRRLQNHLRLARLLRPDGADAAVAELADIIWALGGPGLYVDVVHRRGWSPERYAALLAGLLQPMVNP